MVASGSLLLSACQDEGRRALTAPEIVQFAVSPAAVAIGESATYSWELREAAEAVCALDIGSDGTAEYTLDCGTGSQVHTFAVAGSFPTTLTVTANGQSSSKTAPVVIAADQQPAEDKPRDISSTFTEIEWRPTTSLKFGLTESQAAVVGNKFYVFGGFDGESPYPCCRPTDRAFSFDPATETWERLAPLPSMNGTRYGGVNHSGFATDRR